MKAFFLEVNVAFFLIMLQCNESVIVETQLMKCLFAVNL